MKVRESIFSVFSRIVNIGDMLLIKIRTHLQSIIYNLLIYVDPKRYPYPKNSKILLRIVHRTTSRGRVQTTWTNEGGGGVAQMSTTLNNSYLVKVST